MTHTPNLARIGADGRPWPGPLEMLGVWTRIALLSFGGPAGQIAVMHRILVEEKRWLGEARFLHALNFCMLLPGPEAQQLATYIGWLMHRSWGGAVAGVLFILPGAIAILALSWVYVVHGDVPAVTGVFLGLKAAVLAIVLSATARIGGRALRGAPSLLLAVGSFVALFAFDAPFPLVVIVAGLVGYLSGRRGADWFAGGGHGGASASESGGGTLLDDGDVGAASPRTMVVPAVVAAALWLAPVLGCLLVLGPTHVLSEIALFFSKMAMVTFGGAYAVLAYVAQAGVETHGWLAPGEMLDGLGMAETTPGPLIMVVQFVGFLAAYRDPIGGDALISGSIGAALTTWVTFAPCFLWIFVAAPHVEALRRNRALSSALAAITAAVVGVVLNLAAWFGLHVVFSRVGVLEIGPIALPAPDMGSLDPWSLGLAVAAVLAVFVLRLGTVTVLIAAAALGVTIQAAFP
jgi:chromate transporter